MSAYASLPGSFLPPFFAFGAPSSPSEKDGQPKTDGVDTSVEVGTSVRTDNAQPKDTPASPSSSADRSVKTIGTSAFEALSLSDDSKDLPTASHPSQPSDIVIAFQSARVNPVELIKSLTSKGSNIARRTANFISRTPDVGETTASESASSQSQSATGEGANAEKDGGNADEVSVFSRPGLCYEDTDSDEEYSMYDYSDDFSTPNDSEENEDLEHEQTNSDGDPSAIEFELAITYQGRKYNAKRAFPTFVKLREDLLHEMKNNDRRSRRTAGGAKSPINFVDTECKVSSSGIHNEKLLEHISIPELPRVSPESLGHGGYAQQVARSGFALLQATAQHYCPEMERWMRQVIDAFPCSQSLSSFLWEPLSSSNAGWETIGEDSCNDVSQQEKISPTDSSAFAKPPRGTRSSKAKSSNFSKSSKFRSMGSMGSLNSIDEGHGDDCDCDDDW